MGWAGPVGPDGAALGADLWVGFGYGKTRPEPDPLPFLAVTFLDEICYVLLHCRPKVACHHDLSYEGLYSHVITTNGPVKLFQNILGFFFFNTPQVRL